MGARVPRCCTRARALSLCPPSHSARRTQADEELLVLPTDACIFEDEGFK